MDEDIKGKMVLIVDDELSVREVLSERLEASGFKVITANNGQEGLIAIESDPDLVFLDILMPKMDGLTMLKEVRRHKKYEKIPILLLSNLDDLDTMTRAEAINDNEYLVKTDWKVEEVVEKAKSKIRESMSK